MIIAGGGMLSEGTGHPREAGTFSRMLGKYCSEEKILSMHEDLRKMTCLPAQRLEGIAPSMRKKGRICIGADTDITIFNPDEIIDQAAYEDPARFSKGIEYVLVNGMVVINIGQLQERIYPGEAVGDSVS